MSQPYTGGLNAQVSWLGRRVGGRPMSSKKDLDLPDTGLLLSAASSPVSIQTHATHAKPCVSKNMQAK